MKRNWNLVWFFLGLCSQLQLFGVSLSITELTVLLIAPCVFLREYPAMRRNGVSTFFYLSLSVIVGCIVGSIANRSPFAAVLRGLATTSLISCSIVVSHWIIRRNPGGFKWFLLGVAISVIVSTFFFKRSVEVVSLGESVEEIMSGPLFWISRLKPWFYLPVTACYLNVPIVISASLPLLFALISMLISTSGRSAALGAIGFAAIAFVGGRTRNSIFRFTKRFWAMFFMAVIAVFVIHAVYRVSVLNGWFGEKALAKYEAQSAGENSLGRLIMGGRAESFIGLLGCRDKPIVGWGPWAMDTQGYREEFMSKYGTLEDYEAIQRSLQMQAMYGNTFRKLIPCHAYITEFWLWYGIAGLIFMLYVIFVLLRYLRQDCFAVPQWFGWIACGIPSMFWAIFFSPFADRFSFSLFMVAVLMARAVRKGCFALPEEMQIEIIRTDLG